MSSDLSTVTGVGPKTVERLEEIGITDVDTFCRAYFLNPGQTVAHALNSLPPVHRYFIQHPPDALDSERTADIPIPDAGVVAGMAFAREFGTNDTHQFHSYTDITHDDRLSITPADLTWDGDTMFIAEPQGSFGVLINPNQNDDSFNPFEVDTEPNEVTVNEDAGRVAYHRDDWCIEVDKSLLDTLGEFLAVDYAAEETLDTVRIHPSETLPVFLQVGTSYPLVVAPIVPDEANNETDDKNE